MCLWDILRIWKFVIGKHGSIGEIWDKGCQGEEAGKIGNRRYSPHSGRGRSYGPSLFHFAFSKLDLCIYYVRLPSGFLCSVHGLYNTLSTVLLEFLVFAFLAQN